MIGLLNIAVNGARDASAYLLACNSTSHQNSPVNMKVQTTARLTYLNIRQQVRQLRLETTLSTPENSKGRHPCMYHRDSDKAPQLTHRAPCARGG